MAGSALGQLLENREAISWLKGATSTGFTKRKGVLSKPQKLRAGEDPNRVGRKAVRWECSKN